MLLLQFGVFFLKNFHRDRDFREKIIEVFYFLLQISEIHIFDICNKCLLQSNTDSIGPVRT